MWRPLWIPWRWWRRAVQLALLALFLWLFRRTEFTGADQLPGGENIFFRLDPLLAASAMLGARQWIGMFWPALVVVAATLLLGRFFCGWVCPLGTLLDGFHRIIIRGPRYLCKRARTWKYSLSNFTKPTGCVPWADAPADNNTLVSPHAPLYKNVRHLLLISIFVSALFAFPLVGLVDPFPLLFRGLTFWGDPMFYRGLDASFTEAEEGWIAEVLQPFIQKHVMPYRAMAFHLAGFSATLLGAIFALELIARRFWCRYLCPAGAVFGLLSHRSLVKRLPVQICKTCGQCATVCRMNALDNSAGLSPQNCTLCMDCIDACPKGIVKFAVPRSAKRWSQVRPVDLSRRTILTGIAAGAAVPAVAAVVQLGRQPTVPTDLLRPPGAADEKTFLNLCVRCGECMKVCPTNVLQPTIFESGLAGLFSPRMIPRFIFERTYCEYTCTLCGQVCPTGAIPRLTEEAKHARPTGKAYFDHQLCLPWAKQTPCIRCEEMCPTPEKAIKILNKVTVRNEDGQEVELLQPHVDRDLCVGCGICESNCPVEGRSAIRVQRVDASDPGTEFLLNRPEK